MKRTTLSLLLLAASMWTAQTVQAENWPGWRGPRGDGTSTSQVVPISWDATTGKNLLWKTPLSTEGHSSPIIHGNRAYVVGCVKSKQQRTLVSLDAHTGKVAWERVVFAAPLESKHKLNSYASGTPVTDGKTIYVSFLETGKRKIPAPNVGNKRLITPGRMVVAAYSSAGKKLWMVRPGDFISAHGFCSSPVIYEDLLIVNGDHDGKSYMLALDRKTGKTVWKTDRKYGIRSYVTPLIRKIDGRTQMVVSGSQHITSLDPRTGKRHWIIEGPTEQFVASMVYDGNLFFMACGYPTYHVMGINPRGNGDVTKSHITWHSRGAKCYVPSPVVIDKYLLVADDRGTGNCFNAKTGDRLWQGRLGRHFSGSLVTARGLAFFIADDGITKAVKPGPKLQVVAENKLGEFTYASPAIAHDRFYIRGEKHLFCFGTETAAGK
ncbi:MAG: serine/threonine protein kinase [Planctomycetaceae bacterium]|nr:serine/threonine protein kinase [Planctomycetaceae bacterium]|tara:strand:+ start:2759 stop:4063 length:1305 start_codon:yes stop_codon:yes gene_type:complete